VVVFKVDILGRVLIISFVLIEVDEISGSYCVLLNFGIDWDLLKLFFDFLINFL